MDLKNLSNEDFRKVCVLVRKEESRRRSIRKIENKLGVVREPLSDFSAGEAFAINSIGPKAIPLIGSAICHRAKYYQALIHQNWSCTYPDDNNAAGDYYVYSHVDPKKPAFCQKMAYGGDFKGQPFYIGKGSGDRAYQLKRNEGHGKYIRQLLALGCPSESLVHIAFAGLSEQKAFELEAKLIYFFGSVFEKLRKNTCLLNIEIPKLPEFEQEMVRQPKKSRRLVRVA